MKGRELLRTHWEVRDQDDELVATFADELEARDFHQGFGESGDRLVKVKRYRVRAP